MMRQSKLAFFKPQNTVANDGVSTSSSPGGGKAPLPPRSRDLVHPVRTTTVLKADPVVKHVQTTPAAVLSSLPAVNTFSTSTPFINSPPVAPSGPTMRYSPRVLPDTMKRRPAQTNYQAPSPVVSAPIKPLRTVDASIFSLSAEQQAVLNLVLEGGESVFFTGSAGTGKSVLLRELIRRLKQKYRGEGQIAVTASTGIAACNINGSTLHAFAGCGLGTEPTAKLIEMVCKNRKTRSRWKAVKVLVIDEISMVAGEFFDKLEAIARAARNSTRPFGGIQLVLTGDFFQLPPVARTCAVQYAFEAETWEKCVAQRVQLTHVFRQNDSEFVSMLNEIRFGTPSQKTANLFKSLSREVIYPDDKIEPTQLYPTRGEADTANHTRLAALPGEKKTFVADDRGTQPWIGKLDQMCLAPRVLEIKVNAQVMLLKNIDTDLVNGSRGVVTAFDDNTGYPLVRFTNGREMLCDKSLGEWKMEIPGMGTVAVRNQCPLMLAWSLTMHKAQGQTIERVVVDLARTFEAGQVYVALSRATSLETLQVKNFDVRKVTINVKVVEFMKNLRCVSLKKPSAALIR